MASMTGIGGGGGGGLTNQRQFVRQTQFTDNIDLKNLSKGDHVKTLIGDGRVISINHDAGNAEVLVGSEYTSDVLKTRCQVTLNEKYLTPTTYLSLLKKGDKVTLTQLGMDGIVESVQHTTNECLGDVGNAIVLLDNGDDKRTKQERVEVSLAPMYITLCDKKLKMQVDLALPFPPLVDDTVEQLERGETKEERKGEQKPTFDPREFDAGQKLPPSAMEAMLSGVLPDFLPQLQSFKRSRKPHPTTAAIQRNVQSWSEKKQKRLACERGFDIDEVDDASKEDLVVFLVQHKQDEQQAKKDMAEARCTAIDLDTIASELKVTNKEVAEDGESVLLTAKDEIFPSNAADQQRLLQKYIIEAAKQATKELGRLVEPSEIDVTGFYPGSVKFSFKIKGVVPLPSKLTCFLCGPNKPFTAAELKYVCPGPSHHGVCDQHYPMADSMTQNGLSQGTASCFNPDCCAATTASGQQTKVKCDLAIMCLGEEVNVDDGILCKGNEGHFSCWECIGANFLTEWTAPLCTSQNVEHLTKMLRMPCLCGHAPGSTVNPCNHFFTPQHIFGLYKQIDDSPTVEELQIAHLELHYRIVHHRQKLCLTCPDCDNVMWAENQLEIDQKCPGKKWQCLDHFNGGCQKVWCLGCHTHNHQLVPSHDGQCVNPPGVKVYSKVDNLCHEVDFPRCPQGHSEETIEKEAGTCNVVQCKTCTNNMCYCCGTDLGTTDKNVAHHKFYDNTANPNKCPHHSCDLWLVDLDLRKSFKQQRVNAYLLGGSPEIVACKGLPAGEKNVLRTKLENYFLNHGIALPNGFI